MLFTSICWTDTRPTSLVPVRFIIKDIVFEVISDVNQSKEDGKNYVQKILWIALHRSGEWDYKREMNDLRSGHTFKIHLLSRIRIISSSVAHLNILPFSHFAYFSLILLELRIH